MAIARLDACIRHGYASRMMVMLRLLAACALVSLWIGVVAAGDAPARRLVDLDKPGTLEALRQSNPTHFEKVRQILSSVAQLADADVPSWMVTNFNARDTRYARDETTSFSQRRLSFTLDDTRYTVVVTR
jgi:hypothetical protein